MTEQEFKKLVDDLKEEFGEEQVDCPYFEGEHEDYADIYIRCAKYTEKNVQNSAIVVLRVEISKTRVDTRFIVRKLELSLSLIQILKSHGVFV